MPVTDLRIEPPVVGEVQAISGEEPPDDFLDDIEEPAEVDPSVVRGLLRSISGGASYVVGDPDVPEHWRFTERELDDLVPPLTRIINRRPQLRRAVLRGDEMTVAVVLAGYAGRNVAAGRRAQEVRDERNGEARPTSADGRAGDHRLHGPARSGGGDGGGLHRPPGGGVA